MNLSQKCNHDYDVTLKVAVKSKKAWGTLFQPPFTWWTLPEFRPGTAEMEFFPKDKFSNPRECRSSGFIGHWTGIRDICFCWAFVGETKGQASYVCRVLQGCPSSLLWDSLSRPTSACVPLDSVFINSYRVILGPSYPFLEPWTIYFITARLAKSMGTKASTAIYKN